MSVLDNTADKFIGKGLIFPIKLDSSGKGVISGGKELLESSMRNILAFVIGTRFFLGEFGTKLELLLQEPNDLITQNLLRDYTVGVIAKWEKRLEVTNVELESKSDVELHIRITYRIIGTKLEYTFIYPYYSQLIY